jgi:hypothetical protein
MIGVPSMEGLADMSGAFPLRGIASQGSEGRSALASGSARVNVDIVLEWAQLQGRVDMSDERLDAPEAPARREVGGVINAESAQRLVLVLLALWTLLSGLALTFFQDASDATIGGGLEGGQGAAAQRLLGVHLLVLAPVYGLIAWEPQRFRLLLWVPYAAQGGVVATTLYDIARGDRSFTGGALPLIVAIVFFVLLLYVTFGARKPTPAEEEALTGGSAEPAAPPSPEPPPTQPDRPETDPTT